MFAFNALMPTGTVGLSIHTTLFWERMRWNYKNLLWQIASIYKRDSQILDFFLKQSFVSYSPKGLHTWEQNKWLSQTFLKSLSNP